LGGAWFVSLFDIFSFLFRAVVLGRVLPRVSVLCVRVSERGRAGGLVHAHALLGLAHLVFLWERKNKYVINVKVVGRVKTMWPVPLFIG